MPAKENEQLWNSAKHDSFVQCMKISARSSRCCDLALTHGVSASHTVDIIASFPLDRTVPQKMLCPHLKKGDWLIDWLIDWKHIQVIKFFSYVFLVFATEQSLSLDKTIVWDLPCIRLWLSIPMVTLKKTLREAMPTKRWSYSEQSRTYLHFPQK